MGDIEGCNVSKQLIKSKKRVADHGEVFTPSWLVEAMLDLTEDSDRIETRFLEPACGNGNFLIEILKRKLAIVELKNSKEGHNKSILALIAVMSLYGIELLEDNIIECRNRLLDVFSNYLKIKNTNEYYQAATSVLSMNLVHGDALNMCTSNKQPIIFSEWDYLGNAKFRRRDFRFDLLTQVSRDNQKILEPIKIYESLALKDIASHLDSHLQMEVR